MAEFSNGSAGLDVLGLGNAILDVLAHAEEEFLQRHELAKGTMTLVDAERALQLYREVASPVECSGGSAANTVVGLAALGSRTAFIGKVRDDELGRKFSEDLRAAGVVFRTAPAVDGPPTARCLVLVTPDAQRTMQTFLGASAALSPEDVDPELVRDAKVTYLEGYLWDPEPAKRAFLAAAGIAHEAGRKVSLTLSDPFCVDRHRESFLELVDGHVDLLFANEDEIKMLYSTTSLDEAVGAVRGRCDWVVVTRGPHGAVVIHDGDVIEVPARQGIEVVDTTGAGDLFAAGFLHGWTRGASAADCARLGVDMAADVITQFGARPKPDLRDRVEAIR